MKIFSSPAALAKYLLMALAATLIFFGFSALSYLGKLGEFDFGQALYAFLMFIEGLLVMSCAMFFAKNARLYWLAVILTAVNIIGVIFDQIGLANILFAALNAIILLLLLAYRKTFTALQP
ncbi:MAG: hypothetical protein Fur002_09900 [Anaerolineales bacterium]